MSIADGLRTHLHDVVRLCVELFEALATPNDSLQQTVLMNIELLRQKDELIRSTNRSIVGQLRRDRRIKELRAEIAQLDSIIISFATTLSDLEEEFYTLQEEEEMRKCRELNGKLDFAHMYFPLG